ncbi:MAG: TolC family protein [Vicinamibacterales bacterium]
MFVVLALAAGLVAAAQPPLPPPPLTLAQAVAQAREHSPLRGAATELALGSAEAARLISPALNPFVDVRVENVGAAGRSAALPRDVFALVSQPLEMAGKRALRIGIASADRDVAGANLQIVSWQVSLRTVQFYVQALKARGLLETITANRDGLTTLIDIMRRRVQEGYAAESDLLKFETESARMDIEMARAGLELERSLSALAYVMGAATPISAAQLVEPDAVPPPNLATGAVADAVTGHPELRLATTRVQRLREVAALERARRIPDPVVTAGYKRTNGFDTGVAGVTLSVPLFDRNGASAARAAGEERAAAAERDAVAGRLASEAATLMSNARMLADRSSRTVRELLEPADAVRNAARAAFREGTADVLKLIDAERVYGDVRRVALELRLEALTASLEARFAIGEETLP